MWIAGWEAARSSITWGPVASGGPAAAADVTVTYTYNSLIRDLQRLFDDDPDRDVPASSILVKEATRLGVTVEVKVIPLPGITQASAETAVQTALATYFDTKLLGGDVDYSDAFVIAAQAQVDSDPAVDRIDSFRLGFSSSSLGTDNLLVSDQEYVRLDTVTFIAP